MIVVLKHKVPQEKKEQLIASEVARYYQIAKKIIVENRDFLDAVVEALLDHNTITYREMESIRERIRHAA